MDYLIIGILSYLLGSIPFGYLLTKFFLKKGYEVIGIDNNQRREFFGKDGDTTFTKKQLLKFKNYNHFNIDIRKKNLLENIFKKFR